jgi:hypothetical protein
MLWSGAAQGAAEWGDAVVIGCDCGHTVDASLRIQSYVIAVALWSVFCAILESLTLPMIRATMRYDSTERPDQRRGPRAIDCGGAHEQELERTTSDDDRRVRIPQVRYLARNPMRYGDQRQAL